ncbi:MAG: MaoC family dehydratase [Rhodobacteraceae bacterium]|nr:MaoC family dehydratase [Paracoccaceae bacterium]
MSKTARGRFFEDYRMGEVIAHAVPRTIGAGERALYHALYPARGALHSSDAFARACGLHASPMDDLAVFHTVFGKTVPDISLNAVANLGNAEGRFLAPVWPGDTLSAESEVIGLRPNSNGRTGVVWVRTTGHNQHGAAVLSYVRWVMVRKGDPEAAVAAPVVPTLAPAVAAGALVVPAGLDFAGHDCTLSGGPHLWEDYAPGEIIDHVDAVTIEEAEHMMATRLWQNTARVHFDATHREDGRRLIYGGHVISLGRALAFNGLQNAHLLAGINGGAHVAPCFAGDTVRAWTEVLDRAETSRPSVGALRLRLVVARSDEARPGVLRGEDGAYAPGVLLDFDHWVLMPRGA